MLPAAVTGNKSYGPLGFAIRFIAGFVILTGAFEASRATAFERFVVEDVILAPARYLIDAVTPGDHVELVGRTLISMGVELHVTRGCEGVEMFLMLVAATLAFPANWVQRARGLMMGALLAYGLSLARLMALYYVLRRTPSAWESMHSLVLPVAPIVVLAVFFLRWSATSTNATTSATRAA